MKHTPNFIIGVIVLALLLGATLTYRVRYDEIAVVTLFGRADASSGKVGADGGAGLHFRWPWPVQDVARVYDGRVQLLEDRLEEQQTADKQDIIINAYVAWRISDPLAFFRSLNNIEQGERQLRDRLRDARAQIGQYAFAELASRDPERLKLVEAEEAMRARMQRETEEQGYGVSIDAVGIRRIVLAEAVTEKVFESMEATRKRLAQRARSEGEATANDLRAKARSAEGRILAFAKRRAENIRSEGQAAAAEYYEVFREDEAFAEFLRKLEAAVRALKHNTTFLLDGRKPPFDLFHHPETEE